MQNNFPLKRLKLQAKILSNNLKIGQNKARDLLAEVIYNNRDFKDLCQNIQNLPLWQKELLIGVNGRLQPDVLFHFAEIQLREYALHLQSKYTYLTLEESSDLLAEVLHLKHEKYTPSPLSKNILTIAESNRVEITNFLCLLQALRSNVFVDQDKRVYTFAQNIQSESQYGLPFFQYEYVTRAKGMSVPSGWFNPDQEAIITGAGYVTVTSIDYAIPVKNNEQVVLYCLSWSPLLMTLIGLSDLQVRSLTSTDKSLSIHSCPYSDPYSLGMALIDRSLSKEEFDHMLKQQKFSFISSMRTQRLVYNNCEPLHLYTIL
ncbi:TPA: hypothetical protein ACVO12_003667 [Vibrio diabolicus]